MVGSGKREVVVGIAQWLPAGGDDGLGEATGFVDRLASKGAQLVVLPELWPCAHDTTDPAGVAAEAARRAEPLDGPRAEALRRTAREHRIWLAAGSVPERAGETTTTRRSCSPPTARSKPGTARPTSIGR